MAGLVAICIVPAGFILRLRPGFAWAGSPLLTFFVTAAIILWLLFPIELLSALSALSPWTVFRLTVLRFFARRIGATVIFYTASALLAAGAFGLLYLTFTRASWLVTLTAPFALSAAFLIYGRLLGRMAYLFDQLPVRRRRRIRRKSAPAEDPWAAPGTGSSRKRATKRDPVARYEVASNETNPAALERQRETPHKMVKGYRVADEPLAATPSELPHDGYVPVGYKPVSTTDTRENAPDSGTKTDGGMMSDFGRRYSRQVDEAPPPAHPLVSGVYSFPWYPGTIPTWLLLSLGGAAICALIQTCLALKGQLDSASLG